MKHGIDFKKLKLLKAETLRFACIRTAAKYMDEQRSHINQGVEPDGSAFKPYTKQYLLNKARAGRPLSGPGSWLNATGKMLRSQRMQVEAGPKRVTVYCLFDGERPSNKFNLQSPRKKRKQDWAPLTIGMDDRRMVRNADLARWNNRKRRFVGVTAKGARELLEYFVESLRKTKDYLGKKS
jgi:hypothetical protein